MLKTPGVANSKKEILGMISDCLTYPYPAVLFMLATANYFDIKKRKIPNGLTVPFAILGMGYHLVAEGVLKGLLFSVKGGFFGLILLLIPFLMRGMGGGDVKLLAAIGFWTGSRDILNIFIYGAIAGGIISLVIMITKEKSRFFHRIKIMLINLLIFFFGGHCLEVEKNTGTFPYSLPISCGYVIFLAAGEIFSW